MSAFVGVPRIGTGGHGGGASRSGGSPCGAGRSSGRAGYGVRERRTNTTAATATAAAASAHHKPREVIIRRTCGTVPEGTDMPGEITPNGSALRTPGASEPVPGDPGLPGGAGQPLLEGGRAGG